MFGVGYWDCRYKPRRNDDQRRLLLFVIFVSCGLYLRSQCCLLRFSAAAPGSRGSIDSLVTQSGNPSPGARANLNIVRPQTFLLIPTIILSKPVHYWTAMYSDLTKDDGIPFAAARVTRMWRFIATYRKRARWDTNFEKGIYEK